MSFWKRLLVFLRLASDDEISFPEELLRERLPLGPNSERLARWYLENHAGMKCVGQNVRLRIAHGRGRISGELDLIMELPEPDSPIIFVEVRSRSRYWDRFGTPVQSVDGRKRSRICQAARFWLQQNDFPLEQRVRFDIVSIIWPPDEKPSLCHLPDAFTWQTMVWQKRSVTYWKR